MNTLPLCEHGVCKDCVKLYDMEDINIKYPIFKCHRIIKLHEELCKLNTDAYYFLSVNLIDNFSCPEFSSEQIVRWNPEAGVVYDR